MLIFNTFKKYTINKRISLEFRNYKTTHLCKCTFEYILLRKFIAQPKFSRPTFVNSF